MQELWDFIEGYERYLISSRGRIQNYDTGRMMKLSINNYGDLRVTVRDKDGYEASKSVRLLVGESFVPGRTEIFDTLINLDGSKVNCAADNLAWRPHWHAWKFAHQWKHQYPSAVHTEPIRNISTGSVYVNSIQCASFEGVLIKDIWASIRTQTKVFPHGHSYEVIEM